MDILEFAFVGSSKGMTQRQKLACRELFRRLGCKVMHHGDARGADAQACYLAKGMGLKLHSHPPEDQERRAFVQSDFRENFKTPNERAEDLLRQARYLVAAPKSFAPFSTSGTWRIIRKAQSMGKSIFLVQPDGKVLVKKSGQKFDFGIKK